MPPSDPHGYLTRDLRNWDLAYSTVVWDSLNEIDAQREFRRLAYDWYVEAHQGLAPAESDIGLILWRALREFGDDPGAPKFTTLRAAMQDAWPLPFEPPPPGTLKRLVPQGHYLIRDGGERHTHIETTDFLLWKKWLDVGPDAVGPVMEQRSKLGFNSHRIFGVGDWGDPTYRVIPREYGARYYDALRPFQEFLASYGHYLNFVAFTDSTRVFQGSTFQMQEHWRLVCQMLEGTPVLLSLVNENNLAVNHIDVTVFSKPANITASRGSNGSGGRPVRINPTPTYPDGTTGWWEFEETHWNLEGEWQRKTGHNSMECTVGAWDPPSNTGLFSSGVPCLATEQPRYTDQGSNLQLSYDAAAGAALLCGGSCYHSQRGKLSELWDGLERDCAAAFAAGAHSVPLEFQDGAYRRLEPGDYLRVYQRVLGDGRSHTVTISKGV